MITKEKAIEIAKQYLKLNEDRIRFEESEEFINNKGENEIKNVYVVSYDTEGYQYPDLNFISIDVETGEVLYTVYKHGRVENWEENENGNLLE